MSDPAQPATPGVSYRVVLAHPDHPQRAQRVQALASQDDLVVVGEAPDAEQALRMILDLLPEMAVIWLDLPGLDGVDLVSRLSDDLPAVRILVIGDDDDRAYGALRAGAAGCVATGFDSETAPGLVRRVVRGETLLPPGCAERLLAELEALSADPTRLVARPLRLTPTEREVLGRLASGTSSDEIAELHQVPRRLVNLHAGFALAKLQRAVQQHAQLS
jgi:DNA-binding NarL/FixJ family response regulator